MLQGFLAKLMFEDCTKKTNQFMANTKAWKKKFEKKKITENFVIENCFRKEKTNIF